MPRPKRKNRIAIIAMALSLKAGIATAQESPPQPPTSWRSETDRPLAMQHIQNLRDLGGLPGANGMPIAPHRLYRSGNPALGTPADFEHLDTLHLTTVVDFRAASEKTRAEAPFANRYPWHADPVLAGDLSPATIVPMLKRSTPAQMHDFMINLYRQFPENYQPQFKSFLKLAEANETILYHCTAGKDRTGFATVLLLSALGVDRATIIANYLESNRENATFNARALKQLQQIGIAPEVARPLLDVDADYISAAMEVIDTRYGGMQHYLTDVLHIDIARIRRNYLVAAQTETQTEAQ